MRFSASAGSRSSSSAPRPSRRRRSGSPGSGTQAAVVVLGVREPEAHGVELLADIGLIVEGERLLDDELVGVAGSVTLSDPASRVPQTFRRSPNERWLAA